MARVPGSGAAAVYRAAGAFVDRALRRNGGLFVASRRVWAPETLDALALRLPAPGGAPGVPFEQRWREALAGAPTATVQLAAELVAVHVLFADDLRPATKRRLVDATLASGSGTAGVPRWLDDAFAAGLAGTGVAFKTRRLSQLGLLLAAMRSWKAAPAQVRRIRLADPRAFRDWLAGIAHRGADAQREAFAHLVHPDAFEPIVSPRVKRDIVAGLRHLAPATDDVDEALAVIRSALAPEFGPGFRFVDPPVAALWLTPHAGAPRASGDA